MNTGHKSSKPWEFFSDRTRWNIYSLKKYSKVHRDEALSTKCLFKSPPLKSKVLRWLTEAKTQPQRRDRKTRCRNFCAAVPRPGRSSFVKGPSQPSACWWKPAWRRVWRGLEVTVAVAGADVGWSSYERRRHGRSGLPPM